MVDEDVSEVLVVQDESEEPSMAWVTAVARSRSAVPQREALNDTLQSAGPCKQCEYVAMLLHALELKATEINGQLTVLINLVKYIGRTGLATTFPEETGAFRVQA